MRSARNSLNQNQETSQRSQRNPFRTEKDLFGELSRRGFQSRDDRQAMYERYRMRISKIQLCHSDSQTKQSKPQLKVETGMKLLKQIQADFSKKSVVIDNELLVALDSILEASRMAKLCWVDLALTEDRSAMVVSIATSPYSRDFVEFARLILKSTPSVSKVDNSTRKLYHNILN